MTLVLLVESITLFYIPVFKSDNTDSEHYKIVKRLEEDGYSWGYSTFNNANTITLISNGNVCIAPVDSLTKMNILKWLSSRNWYAPNTPSNQKSAYVVPLQLKQDFDGFLSKDDNATWMEPGFETDNYIVYYSMRNFSYLDES